MSKFDVIGFLPEEKFEKFENDNFSVLRDNLFLRNIKYQNIEILKLLSFLVRDKNWNNYQPSIISMRLYKKNNDLNFEFNLTFGDREKFQVKNNLIIGSNSLKLISSGDFLTNFWTNRIGFNLLLPLEGLVGQAVKITKNNNSIENSAFPILIKPDQPIVKFNQL